MKYLNKIFILICFLASPLTYAQTISDYITEIYYSLNVDHFTSEADLTLHNELVIDEVSNLGGFISDANIFFVRGAKIDGFHENSEGIRYYSFDTDVRLGTTVFFKSDIIRCNDSNCSSRSLFFSAATESMKGVNINAFTLDPENDELLFSIEAAANIDGEGYLAGDIIRFTNEGTFTLEYDSIVAGDGFAFGKNIDGLTLLPNGYFLVSFVNEVARNFIYEFYPSTDNWNVAYTPLQLGGNSGRLSINSLMGFENDLIFKNSLE